VSVEITKRPDFRRMSTEIKKRVRIGMERASEDALTEIKRRTQASIERGRIGQGIRCL
jgi:hypothetical protein